jgi:hypothetical protein
LVRSRRFIDVGAMAGRDGIVRNSDLHVAPPPPGICAKRPCRALAGRPRDEITLSRRLSFRSRISPRDRQKASSGAWCEVKRAGIKVE